MTEKPTKVVCSRCGIYNPIDAHICKNCGASFPPDEPISKKPKG